MKQVREKIAINRMLNMDYIEIEITFANMKDAEEMAELFSKNI